MDNKEFLKHHRKLFHFTGLPKTLLDDHGLLPEQSFWQLFEPDFIPESSPAKNKKWDQQPIIRDTAIAGRLKHGDRDYGQVVLPAYPFKSARRDEWLAFLTLRLFFFTDRDRATKYAEQCGLPRKLLAFDSEKLLERLHAENRRPQLSLNSISRGLDESPEAKFKDYGAFDRDHAKGVQLLAVEGILQDLTDLLMLDTIR